MCIKDIKYIYQYINTYKYTYKFVICVLNLFVSCKTNCFVQYFFFCLQITYFLIKFVKGASLSFHIYENDNYPI